MDQPIHSTRRHLLAQGGAAAVAGVALSGLFTRIAEQNLTLFPCLDFEAWNGRDWDLFRQIHAETVVVAGHGQQTEEIEGHAAWAQVRAAQFPDSRIVAHPIRIGAGDWTAATAITPADAADFIALDGQVATGNGVKGTITFAEGQKEATITVRVRSDEETAAPVWRDDCTRIGPAHWGSTCCRRMRPLPAPAARAASTYDCSLTTRTPARTIRTYTGIDTTPTAMMALIRPGPRIATMPTASRIEGNDSMMSTPRMINWSASPP